MELRIDPLTGVQVQVTGSRQKRPNRPTSGCPFCVGGVEAPDPYEVKAFTNRWPSFPDDRCEVVLFSPDHDAELRTLPASHLRKVVDLWAERTAALGAREDLAYVLVFENNGAEVGATIPHPHGQIYTYPDVPALPATELRRLAEGHRLLEDRPELVVVERDGWRRGSPPPRSTRTGCGWHRSSSGSTCRRSTTATATCARLGAGRGAAPAGRRVRPTPCPTCSTSTSGPFDGGDWPQAWMHVEIIGPHRAPGVMRYVAGAELGSGAYLNPVPPEDAAANLRAVEAQSAADAFPGHRRRPRPGQPDRRVHGLQRWARPPHGHRPRHHGHRHPRGDRVVLRSADEPEPAMVALDVADPATAEPGWARYVAGVVAELRPATGFTGTVTTTLPVGAGLSSSAALEVPVALASAEGTTSKLAGLCQRAEQRASGVPCGIMDQLASAGGVAGHALLIDWLHPGGDAGPRARGCRGAGHPPGQPRQLADSAHGERRAAVEAAEQVLGPLRLLDDPAGQPTRSTTTSCAAGRAT
ncbi:MAG: hypothetical protein U0P45_09450 [Acidimicrobiales bacterium]